MALVQRAVSRALQLDPDTLQGVAEMSGKVIAIDLTGLDISVYAFPHRHGIDLQTDYDGDVHVRITGTPLALLRMASRREQASPVAGEIEIQGDLALSQHLQGVLKQLDIDWEDLLAKGVGDVPAHHIGNLFRGLARWRADAHRSLEMDLSEYLRIEARLVAEGREIDVFMQSVDELRSDTDRLEKRVQRLNQRIQPR